MRFKYKFLLLWSQLKQPHDPAQEIPLRAERNLILDILAEGRRKNTIYLTGEAKIQSLQQLIKMHREQDQQLSLTCCIARAFVIALQEQPEIQSYLKGIKTRVVFKSVDLACMIERELADGSLQPLHYIIRSCEQKNLAELQLELAQAKRAPIGAGGPLSPLEAWFQHWPRWCRRLVWFWIRYDPYTSKQLIGTAGITSMGMFAKGNMLILPISPLTITLSIGGIVAKPRISTGQLVEDAYIQYALAANHDVVDGAPLMRFAKRLQEIIEQDPPALA